MLKQDLHKSSKTYKTFIKTHNSKQDTLCQKQQQTPE
jgi:hypothetical protein